MTTPTQDPALDGSDEAVASPNDDGNFDDGNVGDGGMDAGGFGAAPDVNDPRFDSPPEAAPTEGAQRLDLLDVPLHVTVELGRTKMPIADVLNLASGAVIELEKMAGEPLDLLLNGRLVARGEAVVVGERFGIRITTIVSPRERLARLN